MDATKIDKIEDFADINANMELLSYDKTSKKVGMVPISAVQDKTPYCGCRWKKTNASPEGEPVGDLKMLAQLPSILGLGGYLVQNDHSRRKLSSSNHFQFASGGAAKLDGTMGHYQWGWNIPFYYAQWEDDTYEYEAVSTAPIPGRWNYRIPVASMGASGASALDRTNNILVSFCNRTAQYRGGTNDSSYDTKWNTMLGKPVVNVAEDQLQRCAEKNGDRWGATMDPVIFVLGVLCRIIFHNRNIQAAFNATKTADGLYQGGLGPGVDDVSAQFGNQYGFLDIDALAEKGDVTGVFSKDIDKGDGTKLTINNIPVFFGLKNFYHYIWCMRHGTVLTYNSDATINVYGLKTWTKDAVPTGTTTGLRQVGTIPAASGWQYTKKANLANLNFFPTAFGASESTYYCDGFFHPGFTSGLRGLFALGHAYYAGYAGPGCLYGNVEPSYAWALNGAVLCESEEDWSMEPTWYA
ncbi:MAG: hypothetical protein PUF37_05400 [Prevotellaceae bacterium]|nr:hypothetical protein [Prevotellaceae bacterium]